MNREIIYLKWKDGFAVFVLFAAVYAWYLLACATPDVETHPPTPKPQEQKEIHHGNENPQGAESESFYA
jgi:hypothetical protein